MTKREVPKVGVGDMVHVYIREVASFFPMGVGPYPAIVTLVHPDGKIDGEGFPSEVAGVLGRVPHDDGKGNKDVHEWWTLRPAA